ncbi:MAG: hypothetical protein LIP06_02330 [Tannerellaceae bacterium]|nr:hypothetical protein [Tannerellaceae bacterium]
MACNSHKRQNSRCIWMQHLFEMPHTLPPYTNIYEKNNEIENFKYRIRSGKVILHDSIHPSFTEMDSDTTDDLIYITCIPWISFTHLYHTISLNKDDAVPRISWGKYYKNGDKVLLPFSVQVHHALADGIHVGKYIQKLQNYLDTIQNIQE